MRFYYFIITLLSCSSILPAAGGVVGNTTNGRDYYHVEITLNKDDFRLSHPKEYFDSQWPESTSGSCEFGEKSGGFLIYIKKSIFPVPAPNCESDWLKVVMNGRSDDRANVQTKRALWDRLKAVKAGELSETNAVIELNPYVRVLNDDPLILKLDYCNLYFRTAWGAYIDSLKPIKIAESR